VPPGTFVATPPRDWIAYDGHGPDGISTRGLFYQHGRRRIRLVAPEDPRARVMLVYDPSDRLWSKRDTNGLR